MNPRETGLTVNWKYLYTHRYMFTTAPLFGKFHSPLQDAAQPWLRRPPHHLETLCADRIDPALLQPNETQTNSRERIYTPKLTFLTFLDQVLNPDSSCRSAVDQTKNPAVAFRRSAWGVSFA
jgi:hypothetical protein